MKTKAYVFMLVISAGLLSFINGYPTQGLRNISENLQPIGDWEHLGHKSLFGLLFNKSFLPPEDKGSSAYGDLIAKCQHTKGEHRVKCVAAYIRDLYPESFKSAKDVGESMDKERKITTIITPSDSNNLSSVTVTIATTSFSKTTSALMSTTRNTPTSKTNCQSAEEQRQKLTTPKSKRKGEILMSSAVLIVPGDPKIIMSVIQDAETYVPNKHVRDERIKPVTCRKDEFGFAEDVDPRIVDIANDMLCSLCKQQRDSVCIIRWCINI